VILIVDLSALAIKGIQNRCFSSNYEDTSPFGNSVPLTVGKRSFETEDNAAPRLINLPKHAFVGTTRDWEVLN